LVSAVKDPVKVRAGSIGARRRWGERRIVRLDDLTAPQRRLVLALVDAARKETTPVIETSGVVMEDDGAGRRAPTAA
jgi:hypothetical protein